MSLNVLFEDYHLIAVNKPAGLPTQAPVGIDSLEARVRAYIKEKYQKPAGVYLGIPHRLDKPVSGVVVFARNSKAASRVAVQFQERTAQKVYWALIVGKPPEEAGIWEDWIRKIPDVAKAESAKPDAPDAKQAIVEYRIQGAIGEFTGLELRPKTGRMHQLRIQAALHGFPIVGDTLYGSTRTFLAEDPSRIALFARSLEIVHPFRKEPLRIEAPIDPAWFQEIGVRGQEEG